MRRITQTFGVLIMKNIRLFSLQKKLNSFSKTPDLLLLQCAQVHFKLLFLKVILESMFGIRISNFGSKWPNLHQNSQPPHIFLSRSHFFLFCFSSGSSISDGGSPLQIKGLECAHEWQKRELMIITFTHFFFQLSKQVIVVIVVWTCMVADQRGEKTTYTVPKNDTVVCIWHSEITSKTFAGPPSYQTFIGSSPSCG